MKFPMSSPDIIEIKRFAVILVLETNQINIGARIEELKRYRIRNVDVVNASGPAGDESKQIALWI